MLEFINIFVINYNYLKINTDYKKVYIQLLGLIKEIRAKNNLPRRNEDLAKILGYNRSYFSTLTGKNGVITQEHLKNLLLHFPELKKHTIYYDHLLENVTRGTLGDDSDTNKISPDENGKSLEKALKDLKEWQAGVNATLAVLRAELIPILAKINGKSNASVSSQLKKDIDEATANQMASSREV